MTPVQLLRASCAPIAVLVLHAIAGALLGHEPYVDPVAHLLGGAAAAFFFRSVCSASVTWIGRPTSLALDLLAVGLTSSVAYLWELGEFLSDRLLGTEIQWSAAIVMRDLSLGILGGASCLLLARAVRFLRRDGPR